MDKLDQVFEWQETLNNAVFVKKDIRNKEGKVLKMADIKNSTDLGPNGLQNQWISNYLTADEDESRELREELFWKWWSKDTLDMQNIKVEIIDKMHFIVSMAISAGMTAEDFYNGYKQKMELNHKRQENNYSKANKDESDNRAIEFTGGK